MNRLSINGVMRRQVTGALEGRSLGAMERLRPRATWRAHCFAWWGDLLDMLVHLV